MNSFDEDDFIVLKEEQSKTLNVPIKNVSVISGRAASDVIVVELDLPSAFPGTKQAVKIRIEAQHGFGATWCREILKLEPDVIRDS